MAPPSKNMIDYEELKRKATISAIVDTALVFAPVAAMAIAAARGIAAKHYIIWPFALFTIQVWRRWSTLDEKKRGIDQDEMNSRFEANCADLFSHQLARAVDPIFMSFVKSSSWNTVARLIDPDLGRVDVEEIGYVFDSVDYVSSTPHRINCARQGLIRNLKELGPLNLPRYDPNDYNEETRISSLREFLKPMFELAARTETARRLEATLTSGARFLTDEQKICAIRAIENPLLRDSLESLVATKHPSLTLIEMEHIDIQDSWDVLLNDFASITRHARPTELARTLGDPGPT